MHDENIFEKGCLVQLTISMWGAVRKVDRNRLSEIAANGNGGVDSEWLRATKRLIDPEALKPIQKVGNAARNYLAEISLPFPVVGLSFVPKDLIGRVDSRLEEFKGDFQCQVEGFAAQYHDLRDAAKACLGDLFNELDYPVDINQRFSFAWRFVIMDLPNGRGGVLTPEMYEREKEKFVRTMQEAREIAVMALRKEFSEMVTRICDRFTKGPDGKVKIFKSSTIEGFYEFCETFKERNIFRDSELAELVDKAKAIIGGNSAERFRGDEILREQVGKSLRSIEGTMSQMNQMPRRMIDMS